MRLKQCGQYFLKEGTLAFTMQIIVRVFVVRIREFNNKKIGADTSVVPVNHMSFPTIAKRPMFSAMASEKNTCGRHWEEALSDFLEYLD